MKHTHTRLVIALVAVFPPQLACGGKSYVPTSVGGQDAPPPAPSYGEALYDMEMEAAPPGGTQGYAAQQYSAAPGVHADPHASAMSAPQWNTEAYDHTPESDFKLAVEEPLSTFSVDVDTASYSNVRRFLSHGQRPPIDAVRIEELINYFDYAYPKPTGEHPVSMTTEVADCPWDRDHKLVRIGLRAADREAEANPPRNLVFLLDVSGSMEAPNKLPLLKSAVQMLVEQLDARDTVAIVTYAGSSGVALPPTRGDEKREILWALDNLRAGGSTNGAEGIELAYQLAARNRISGAVNRVILATDGDFNVGVTSRGALERLIEGQRDRGVFLTMLGFGMGNLKDATMEMLADKGNGTYAYIDTWREAQKVLVEEMDATLQTVAKDTKIQVEFNPARVARYRLLGYENRRLANQDFNDDRKDAGDMGDGHTVTALYEVELARGERAAGHVDPLKYQAPRPLEAAAQSRELLTVKLRYKEPEGQQSRLLSSVVEDRATSLDEASDDMRFATAVALFGSLLRDSSHTRGMHLSDVRDLAQSAIGEDRDGYRREFLELVTAAGGLAPEQAALR